MKNRSRHVSTTKRIIYEAMYGISPRLVWSTYCYYMKCEEGLEETVTDLHDELRGSKAKEASSWLLNPRSSIQKVYARSLFSTYLHEFVMLLRRRISLKLVVTGKASCDARVQKNVTQNVVFVVQRTFYATTNAMPVQRVTTKTNDK